MYDDDIIMCHRFRRQLPSPKTSSLDRQRWWCSRIIGIVCPADVWWPQQWMPTPPFAIDEISFWPLPDYISIYVRAKNWHIISIRWRTQAHTNTHGEGEHHDHHHVHITILLYGEGSECVAKEVASRSTTTMKSWQWMAMESERRILLQQQPSIWGLIMSWQFHYQSWPNDTVVLM